MNTPTERETYYNAAHLMQDMGGSFAHHIALAWFFADSTNRATLEEAFKPLFNRYADMSASTK